MRAREIGATDDTTVPISCALFFDETAGRVPSCARRVYRSVYVCGLHAVHGATLPSAFQERPRTCAPPARRHRDGSSPTAGAAAYKRLLARALETHRRARASTSLLLMYPYTFRAAASSSSSTALGFALGRIGGTTRTAPGLVVPAAGVARGRSVSSTPAGSAPVPGDQGVGMDQPKQQQPKVPPQDAAGGENKRDDMHKHTR